MPYVKIWMRYILCLHNNYGIIVFKSSVDLQLSALDIHLPLAAVGEIDRK